MRVRFYNGRLCAMGERLSITSDELWTENERIAYVGPPKPAEQPFDREIDLSGNLVLPGFKNAHTHSAMTFLRSYADDLPLLEWLNRQVFPMEAKLDGDMAYHLSKLAIMEYLTSGITANFDMYAFIPEVARASVDCGFRTVFCGEVNNFTGSVGKLEEDFLRLNELHPLISHRLGFHAEYTCNRAILEGVAHLAGKYKAPVYCHNSESRAEVEDCTKRNGMTPTAYLDSLGTFRYGGGGFHCVHLTEEDMDIFRDRGMWAITCPGSNCKLASGIAPLTGLGRRGVSIAIGTDGPASNNCLDFFREMFLCTGLQKLRENEASAMDAGKVLWMAATGGALAMGLPDCDSLAPGKLADLTVLDLAQPNMQPLNNIAKNVVYSGSKQNVKLTMVGGRILYENGRFDIGVEPAEVYAKANEIIAAMRC